VGLEDGPVEGLTVVGIADGSRVGETVGMPVGESVEGLAVGCTLGQAEGSAVEGLFVGAKDGTRVEHKPHETGQGTYIIA
jgi:hypothetical protein